MKYRYGLTLLVSVMSAQAQWLEPEAAAHVDRAQQLAPPLRWDNVEDGPLWLQGPRPQYDSASGLHTVTLAPGESLSLRLPAGAWLRLHDPRSALCAGEYEVAMGGGSGLYAAQLPLLADQPDNLLFPDRLHDERVALITRVGARCDHSAATSAGALALFVSRRETLGNLAPYRDTLTLPGPTVRVHGRNARDYHDAHVLEPARPAPLDVQGPLRIAVQTRLLFPQVGKDHLRPPWAAGVRREAGSQSRPLDRKLGRLARNVDEYQLLWTRDEPSLVTADCTAAAPGAVPALWPFSTLIRAARCQAQPVWRRLAYDTTPEYSDPVAIDGCLTPSGRLETRYLEIPAGPQRFYLTASSPLLLRLRAAPRQDYLLPGLNPPLPPADTVQGALPTPGRPADAASIQRLDQALSWAGDNTRREGTLRAAQLLLSTPAQAPLSEALHDEGRRLWDRYTFYRNLLPHVGGAHQSTSFAWVLPPRLAPFTEHGKSVSTATALRDAALMGLDGAYFVPWATAEGKSCSATEPAVPLQYRLPERHAASRLRLLLDLPESTDALTLWAQLDDAAPLRLIASRADAAPLEDLLPSPAEAGLALVQRQGFDIWSGLAASHAPAALLRPLTVELPLPAQAQRLKLWTQEPACGSRVAAQYRSSRTFSLSESEYPRVLEQVQEPLRLPLLVSLLQALDAQGRPVQQWAVQIGEFDTHEAAARKARVLRESGHATSERLMLQADGSERWQVLIAPLSDRAAARQLAARLGQGAAVLQLPQDAESALRHWQQELTPHNSELAALGQHWLPLLRLLQDRIERYSAPAAPEVIERTTLPPLRAALMTGEARRLAAAGEWINALERWAKIGRGSSGALRREALLGQAQALRQLGEAALAEQLLRGTALHDADPVSRRAAQTELLAQYRAEGEDALSEGLLAASLLRERDQAPHHARLLVQQFLDSGEPEFALSLGLLLPPCYQPVETLVQAAFEARWGQVFETLLPRLADADDRAWWRGLRSAREGDFEASQEHWRAAGARAGPWAAALDSGQVIAGQLAQRATDGRRDALSRWVQWSEGQPGPRRWSFAPERVSAHAGLRTIEMLSRGVHLQSFRAGPQQPVRLNLSGPARLRLEMRPMHRDVRVPRAQDAQERPMHSGDSPALDGWIHIEHNGRLRVLPFSHNTGVAGLEVLEEQRHSVGRAEEAVLELGPGEHEIKVFAPAHTLLLRPHEYRPVLPLPVLPPLAPETLAAVLANGLPSVADNSRRGLPRLDAGTLYSPQRLLQTASCGSAALPSLPPPLYLAAVVQAPPALDCSVVAEPPPDAPALPPPPPLIGVEPPRAETLASTATNARLARLIELLWWSESRPERAAELQAAAEALVAAGPPVPGAAGVLARLRSRSNWEPVDAVDSSAGLYTDALRGWQPESPALRARRALLPAMPKDALVLYGKDTAAVRLVNLVAAQVHVELRLHELPFAHSAPMRMKLLLDGGLAQTISLGPQQRQARRTLAVPAGEHVIELRAQGNYANQFVAARVIEETAEGERAIAPETLRPFHVATHDEPIKLRAGEPAWLRIEEQRGAETLVSYRQLVVNQTLTLPPPPGADQALYRLHRRVPRGADLGPARASELRRPAIALLAPTAPSTATDGGSAAAGVIEKELMSPALAHGAARGRTPEPPEPARNCGQGCRDPLLQVRDYFPLGGQEDGTWGLDQRLVNLRAEGEDRLGGDGRNKYLELAANHRYYSERRHSYQQIEALLRVHDEGDPTLGLRGWFDWEPRHRPWSLQAFGSYFAQHLETGPNRGWAGAALARVDGQWRSSHGTRAQNTFDLGLFRRWLSLAHTPLGPAEGDLDIYSRYKDQHRQGCQIWDRYSFAPWLDSQAFLRAGLVCNEDLDPAAPDYADVTAGWRQLAGRLGLELDYRYRRYYKDSDRARKTGVDTARLALDLDWWPQSQRRWSLRFEVWHDRDRNGPDSSSGLLALGWHYNNGRGLLDYRPSDAGFLGFKALRQQRWAAGSPNNWLGEGKWDP